MIMKNNKSEKTLEPIKRSEWYYDNNVGKLLKLFLILMVFSLVYRVEAEPKSLSTSTVDYSEIGWEELMPEGEEERLAEMYLQNQRMLYGGGPIMEGSAADTMVQIGTFNTVPELNQVRVRIPGYTVPFEYGKDAEVTEFLLVPYFGACIHAPPPPPNQTVFVLAKDPLKLRDLPQAVWIEGTMYTQTQNTDLADAAYTIKLDKIERYEY